MTINTISGIDEAGRGAVLGPLIIAGVTIRKEDTKKLEELGIKDSKLLTKKRREILNNEIKSIATQIIIEKIEPIVIDNAIYNGKSLNTLELEYFARIVRKLDTNIIYVDAPDVNLVRVHKILKNSTRKMYL